jgi:anti-anti-sigma factor
VLAHTNGPPTVEKLMNIAFKRSDIHGVPMLTVNGDLDIDTSGRLLMATDDIAAEGKNVLILDLQGLNLLDSTGVTELVLVKKRFKRRGGNVYITNASEVAQRVLGLLHLEETLDVLPTAEDVLRTEAARRAGGQEART